MKRVLSLLAIATLTTASLSLTACEAPRPRLEKRAVHVKHLHDGRWAYQADNGDWYIYYLLLNGQQTPYMGDTAPSVGSYGGGVMSLTETTLTETDLSGAIDSMAEASFGTEGSPASASEVSADISVESGGESSAGDTGSSDGGSSGGDSGGGDSGGGGGDGGGGGGDG